MLDLTDITEIEEVVVIPPITRFAHIVMGHKGHGKSTYCKVVKNFSNEFGRNIKIVNFDPTVNELAYESAVFDIRNYITSEDYTNANQNDSVGGGISLVFSFVLKNPDIFLNSFGDPVAGDIFLIDCPGDRGVYHQEKLLQSFGAFLDSNLIRNCIVFTRDVQKNTDGYSFITGCLTPIVSLLVSGIRHAHVFMKSDLLSEDEKSRVVLFTNSDLREIFRFEAQKRGDVEVPKSVSICATVVDSYVLSRGKFVLMDINDPDQVKSILNIADELMDNIHEEIVVTTSAS